MARPTRNTDSSVDHALVSVDNDNKDLLKLSTEFMAEVDPGNPFEHHESCLLMVQGKAIGFITYRTLSAHRYHITAVYINKANRKRGYSNLLFELFIQEYQPKSMRIGLEQDNPAAYALYKSVGFKIIASGTEDGKRFFVMQYTAKT